MFIDYDVVDNDRGIHSQYISKLVANDWGLHKTLDLNLKKTKAFVAERDFPEDVTTRIDTLIAHIEAHPKTMSWKARAMVGERIRWYELPEEPR